MSKCLVCGEEKTLISSTIGICLSCIRSHPNMALKRAEKIHRSIREKIGLPGTPPNTRDGVECTLCVNNCRIGEDEIGYCGLRRNKNGQLIQPSHGLLHTYYDSLPTNCCASWFCPGSREKGLNLAVFPFGCTFNCLFCQNYEHKNINLAQRVSIEELVRKAEKARCVCYFGGTPEPQLPFLLETSKKILELDKHIRICWEWNGTGNRKLVDKAAEYSYQSNGVIKFDLKAYDENLHMVLTGRSNKTTLSNFEYIAQNYPKRDLLTATTLMIPGYIDAQEVEEIARFIASIDPDIPYSLLAFHPDYYMNDLPTTSIKQAEECYQAARKHLNRVNIGNKHLLRV